MSSPLENYMGGRDVDVIVTVLAQLRCSKGKHRGAHTIAAVNLTRADYPLWHKSDLRAAMGSIK
ncbi:hypothetical protein GSI_14187 [Ganoderma sinense ZZ0214-1]|uniref:Uncharacterized protein n=1 Tax=Ganoderma sinense ZZ0214-1 TaxID=1077348 RepID=A0A2G8RSG3_9APHY|nr:hypothetical protein GSI_14187 [Ganoderma sinense ZZ0214-1]